MYLYVVGHDKATIARLADFCERSTFAGVIFTRDGLPGTFPLARIHIDSPDAPDVAIALRWIDERNAAGFPGEIFADGGRRSGQGTHGTLSRYEMHNTLVASGPDFRKAFRDELPSSNADLAPTIAHLLGLAHPPMDGRVLSEAFAGAPGDGAASPQTAPSERLEAKSQRRRRALEPVPEDQPLGWGRHIWTREMP